MKFTELLQKSLARVWPQSRSVAWRPIHEPYAGAWQNGHAPSHDDMLANQAVWACIQTISNDIGKLAPKLLKLDADAIWQEVENPAYSPVLRRPNPIDDRISFYSNWVSSLLQHGNTYILKKKDMRGVVKHIYILNPLLCSPLVSESGEILYELAPDNLAGIEETVIVPASEIIHCKINTFIHPLVGLSPLSAAAMSVRHSTSIQNNSTSFFENHGRPGGTLTASGAVSDETVEQLKKYWKDNYSGNNSGNVAVLADGLTYQSFDMANAADSQVIEQLKYSAEVVCSVFNVPAYRVGIGALPPHNSIIALNTQYYSQTLQILIEKIELCLNEGLNISNGMGVEFDLNGLLRLDASAQMDLLDKASGKMTPNEMRKVLNLSPILGGDTVYLQQQNFGLEALAKRDAQSDPFSTSKSEPYDEMKAWQIKQTIKAINYESK